MVKKEEAESTIKRLKKLGVFDTTKKVVKKGDFVYIPVTKTVEGFKVVDIDLPERYTKPRDLKDALRRKGVPEDVISLVTTSFDIVGHVAIIELRHRVLEKWKNVIAQAIMEVHKNVKTVAVKSGVTQGVFRVRPITVVAGKESLETVHIEHGVKMKLDPSKVYFSVRHSYERKRIAELVKSGEVVGVFFAGVGPYPLVIAKLRPSVRLVYGIELNPYAWRYMVENIRLNGMENKVIAIRGDVKDVAPRMFKNTTDRVVMPLPKDAGSFLKEAVEVLREKGYIHMYTFAEKGEGMKREVEKVEETLGQFVKKVEVLGFRKVADYSPSKVKMVIDLYVVK